MTLFFNQLLGVFNMDLSIIKQLPKGEFFKLKDSESSPVWVRGEYDRTSRTYSIYKFDDINHETFVRGSRSVFVGFTF
jgi:hypothetical protein